ncbi:MAG: hypothetical protein JO105_13200 [Hyphomicrobiales bacterium]|nr:hypothetical protein [Hyphomicrobiales bacterium]
MSIMSARERVLKQVSLKQMEKMLTARLQSEFPDVIRIGILQRIDGWECCAVRKGMPKKGIVGQGQLDLG